jgi:hypothetical protein
MGACVLAGIAASTSLVIGHVVKGVEAQQSRPGVMVPTLPALAVASAPARMTKADVLAAASTEFGTSIASHPTTIQYGSFSDPHLQVRGGTRMVPAGARNVWRVTVTGLDVSRPCDVKSSDLNNQAACPPAAQTLIMYFDDASGKFLEGVAY